MKRSVEIGRFSKRHWTFKNKVHTTFCGSADTQTTQWYWEGKRKGAIALHFGNALPTLGLNDLIVEMFLYSSLSSRCPFESWQCLNQSKDWKRWSFGPEGDLWNMKHWIRMKYCIFYLGGGIIKKKIITFIWGRLPCWLLLIFFKGVESTNEVLITQSLCKVGNTHQFLS